MCFAFALQETNISPNPQSCSLCLSLSPLPLSSIFPHLSLSLPPSFSSCFLHIYSFFHLHIFNFNSESKRQMKLVWFSLPPPCFTLTHPLSLLSKQAPPSFLLCAFLHMPLLPSLSSALTMVFALAHYTTHRPLLLTPYPASACHAPFPIISALRVLSISSVFCSVALYGNQHTLQVLLLLLLL